MGKIGKLSKMLFLSAIAAVLIPVSVKAATVNAAIDKENCEVGDTITLSITSEGADGAAEAPEISITFDPNRLSFSACTTPYGGGDGGLVTINETESDMTFIAISGGSAGIDVSAVYDGDGANPSMASCTVEVNGEDTASMMGDETMSSTGVEAGTIESADGTKLVSSVFANEFMPKGFYKTTVTYEEQMVEAAQFDMGNIMLLYVTDPVNNEDTFCMYDQATGELSDFLQISGIENKFIIALKAGEEVEPPKNFTKATLQWNSKVLEAYAYTGEISDEAGPSIGDFFLIYAISSEGNKGWYMYDQNEGTYQRFVEGLYTGKSEVKEHGEGILSSIASVASPSEDGKKGGLDVKLIVILVMAVLLLILLIMLIITFVKLRDYESYDYIDEDEEFEGVSGGQMGGYVPESKPVSKPVKKPAYEEDDIPMEKPAKKVKASDLVQRDMSDGLEEPDDNENIDDIDNNQHIEELEEDESIFSPHMKPSREDKKRAKAEEKAARKAEKQRRKDFGDFGDNGSMDWESFGSSYKEQEVESMPATKKNPHYDMDELEAELDGKKPKKDSKYSYGEEKTEMKAEPVRRPVEEAPVPKVPEKKPAPVKEPQPQKYQRNPMGQKENPMDMIKSIPANDTNKPVQPRPVQQVDLDEDFEFEFIKLDDD